MDQESFEDIDDLISRWISTVEPSEEEYAEMRDEVLESLGAGRVEVADTQLVDSSTSLAFIWKSFGAIAATLIIAAGFTTYISTADRTASSPQPTEIPISAFTQVQVVNKQQLFSSIASEFQDQVNWIAETDSDLEIGLQSADTSSKSVAMRIVLAKRKRTEEQWLQVWEVDVVTYDQQLVQMVDTKASEKPELSTWSYLLPDGMLACDVDFAWKTENDTQHLSDSLLIKMGSTQAGKMIVVGDDEYQLFHTASLLKG